MKINVPIEVGEPTIIIQFPESWPLMEGITDAAKRFGIGATTLRKLCRQPGFPSTHVGASLLIDIPRAYAWFGGQMGGRIPTD